MLLILYEQSCLLGDLYRGECWIIYIEIDLCPVLNAVEMRIEYKDSVSMGIFGNFSKSVTKMRKSCQVHTAFALYV